MTNARTLLTRFNLSDGKSAEEQVSQILAIAPVLPQNLMGQIRAGPQAEGLSKDAQLPATQEADLSCFKGSDGIQSQRVERLDSVAGGTDEFVDAKS